jgi:hypothetical protein
MVRQCRVCFGKIKPPRDGAAVAPCLCKGSGGYMHQGCAAEQVRACGPVCGACKAAFAMTGVGKECGVPWFVRCSTATLLFLIFFGYWMTVVFLFGFIITPTTYSMAREECITPDVAYLSFPLAVIIFYAHYGAVTSWDQTPDESVVIMWLFVISFTMFTLFHSSLFVTNVWFNLCRKRLDYLTFGAPKQAYANVVVLDHPSKRR